MVRTSGVILVVVMVVCGGCGGSSTSPVEGVVTLNGKPLAGAAIQFVPQGKGRDATGETDQDGQFAMSTFGPRDGVLPGSYKVIIAPPAGPADTTQYATSEEAMAAASKRQPKKMGTAFPAKYSRPDLTPITQDVPVTGKLKLELKS